eukprot:m.34622 g.34622  ORF g.34622 m.34622 type:complete len:512 (-) comp5243_c0_seq1:946-2481(-)
MGIDLFARQWPALSGPYPPAPNGGFRGLCSLQGVTDGQDTGFVLGLLDDGKSLAFLENVASPRESFTLLPREALDRSLQEPLFHGTIGQPIAAISNSSIFSTNGQISIAIAFDEPPTVPDAMTPATRSIVCAILQRGGPNVLQFLASTDAHVALFRCGGARPDLSDAARRRMDGIKGGHVGSFKSLSAPVGRSVLFVDGEYNQVRIITMPAAFDTLRVIMRRVGELFHFTKRVDLRWKATLSSALGTWMQFRAAFKEDVLGPLARIRGANAGRLEARGIKVNLVGTHQSLSSQSFRAFEEIDKALDHLEKVITKLTGSTKFLDTHFHPSMLTTLALERFFSLMRSGANPELTQLEFASRFSAAVQELHKARHQPSTLSFTYASSNTAKKTYGVEETDHTHFDLGAAADTESTVPTSQGQTVVSILKSSARGVGHPLTLRDSIACQLGFQGGLSAAQKRAISVESKRFTGPLFQFQSLFGRRVRQNTTQRFYQAQTWQASLWEPLRKRKLPR